MNCALFALSFALEEPPEIVATFLRRFVERGLVAMDSNDEIQEVILPEAIVAAASDLGVRGEVVFGNNLTVNEWAEKLADKNASILLITNSHVLVAKRNRLYDNNHPEGQRAGASPYSGDTVERVMRLWVE